MTEENARLMPSGAEFEDPGRGDVVVLKTLVALLAVTFIAAPVAYGAYEINALSAPDLSAWRWPAIVILALGFGFLSWWVVRVIRRQFPYS